MYVGKIFRLQFNTNFKTNDHITFTKQNDVRAVKLYTYIYLQSNVCSYTLL